MDKENSKPRFDERQIAQFLVAFLMGTFVLIMLSFLSQNIWNVIMILLGSYLVVDRIVSWFIEIKQLHIESRLLRRKNMSLWQGYVMYGAAILVSSVIAVLLVEYIANPFKFAEASIFKLALLSFSSGGMSFFLAFNFVDLYLGDLPFSAQLGSSENSEDSKKPT